MAWKDTYAELGAEIQAAKTAAIAAFMAAPAEAAIGAGPAVPPVLSRQQRAAAGIPLSSGDRAKVLTVTWRAISQAVLKHIGPVSTDNSVLISQQNDGDNVPQLNLRVSTAPGQQPDPVVQSSFLYPAKVPDPLNLGDVRCVFGEHGCTEFHTFSSGPWTQSGDTFTRPVVGPLPSSWFDGLDTMVWDDSGYSTLVGQIVICPPTDDLLGDDLKTWGAFEVLDTGMHMDGYTPVYTYAKLRRIGTLNTSADFHQGITFHVLEGNVFGGMYATLQNASVNLGVDDQDWHFTGPGSPPAWSDSYELLSSAEITTRGATSATLGLSATATAGSSNMATSDGHYDFSTVGVLPDVLPAGKIDFFLKDVVLSGSRGNGTENVIICQLIDNDGLGGLSVIATGTTQHIDWSTLYSQSARDLTCQGAIATDWVRTPGHFLTLRYLFYTDSSTAVSCSFTYNSADRYTKVGTTWENAIIGGTTEHDKLTHASRWLPNQHPWSSITDDFGTATVVGGTLTMPAGKRKARVTGASVYRIDSTGFSDGDEIWLFFADATPSTTRILAANDGSATPPIYALGLPPIAGGSVGQNHTMRAPSLVRLWLDTTGHCWRPAAWPPAGSSEVGT